jgi:hypothetical protein
LKGLAERFPPILKDEQRKEIWKIVNLLKERLEIENKMNHYEYLASAQEMKMWD